MIANDSVFNSLLCGGVWVIPPPILAERRVVGQFTHEKKTSFWWGKKGRHFLELTEVKGRLFA